MSWLLHLDERWLLLVNGWGNPRRDLFVVLVTLGGHGLVLAALVLGPMALLDRRRQILQQPTLTDDLPLLIRIANGEVERFQGTSEETRRLLQELQELGQSSPLTASFKKFFLHPSFPVDPRHNAKIFRDRLGVWASLLDKRGRVMEAVKT